VVAAIFAFVFWNGNRSLSVTLNSAPGQTRSVGVLSFADMSAAQDQEYFADGIAQEILHALASIPDVRVAGRTSSFSFKGQNVDMRTIGKSLNVSHLIDGSVRSQGQNLRIAVQLINTDDGLSVWSKSYDGTQENSLDLQKQVSLDIVSELKVILSIGIEQVIILEDPAQ
jgi:TolB-like protein